MKALRKIAVVSVLALAALNGNAQQDPMYTHYMYNTLSVNPAYAGSRDALTVTGLHRSQWVSFSGAPMTQTITLHSPLRNEKIGLGLTLLNDKIGPTNNTSIFGDFAYRIKLNEKSKLAFGLSGGVNIFQARLSTLQLDQQSDPTFQNNISNKVIPNFGAGIYYSRERFYAGISAPGLLQNNYSLITVNGNDLIGKEQRHYFFIAGAMIKMGENLDFKPTTLIKVTNGAPAQADLTAAFVIKQKFLLGANFRTGDSFGALIGFDFTDLIHLGYSYDWSYGLKTGKYNSGSHEVILRCDFLRIGKKQIHSPRYF